MRWRAAAVAAVCSIVLVAGCGADGSPTVAGPPSSSGSTTATRVGDGVGPTTTTGTSPTTTGSVEVVEPPAEVGAYAPTVLGRTGATSITLDVLEQETATPRQDALDHVVAILKAASQKPVDVRRSTIAGGARAWTHEAVVETAARDGRAPTADDAVLHLLFVNGHYAEGGDDGHRVLGVSVRGDVAAVFVDDVDGAGSPLVSPARIEAAVATHELGHLLGLVDLVVDTGRADPAHPGHSSNPRSVMYWAVESDLVSDLLAGGPPDDFDDADRADLARLRNR